MIVSYKHQFIFVHLGRTGGRSLTESLIPHCGSDDIITPIGDLPGQNHRGWHRHESALSIRDRLGRDRLSLCWGCCTTEFCTIELFPATEFSATELVYDPGELGSGSGLESAKCRLSDTVAVDSGQGNSAAFGGGSVATAREKSGHCLHSSGSGALGCPASSRIATHYWCLRALPFSPIRS